MDSRFLSSPLLDESTPHQELREPYLRFHAVKIFVRDQDRSLRFYLDQLGFGLVYDTRLQSGERWLAVAPPDGTAILALVAPRPSSREYKLIGRATQISFVTDDVIAKFHEWSARGVKFLRVPRLKRIKYERKGPDGDSNPLSPDSTAVPHSTGPSSHSTGSGMLLGDRAPIWGAVFTRFEDLDGNSFSLVSFDEVSQTLDEQRRAMAEKLESERRAAQELEIAKQVQARLFPQTLPPLTSLDYAGTCIQARKVGGDYYDFLDLGQGRGLGL